MKHDGIAVRCTAVTKEFGAGSTRIQVLRGIDWKAPLGGMSMLVGPSGCGKTTLLSVITGLLDITSGTVEILGEDLHRLSAPKQIAFRRRHLGFIFQQYNLLPALTAAENAAVPLLAAGARRDKAVARARDLLTKLGMENQAHQLPRTLSGGQQQRVAIARALINEPRLIVCDEPTAALDAETGHAVMELMAEVAVAPDRAVIVVTHDNRIFGFADSITRMEDGRILHTQPRAHPEPHHAALSLAGAVPQPY